MKRIILLLVAFVALLGSASAQVKYEINAPNIVMEGQRFHIEFILVNEQVKEFSPPTFTGLEILAGPVKSNGMFYYDLNGKKEQGTTVTHTYTVQAKSDISIATIGGSAVVAENGKTYKTSQTTIEIRQKGSQSTPSKGSGTSNSNSLTAKSVLLRIDVDKKDVYKGEVIVATLKLYTQVGIAGIRDSKIPAFNGFWKQELNRDTGDGKRVTLNGKPYQMKVLKEWLISPQKSGRLTIEQCEINAVVETIVESERSGSMFDDFFGLAPSVRHIDHKVVSPTVNITVKDLPKPIPENYTGGVGDFYISSNISTSRVTANSGGSLFVEIRGTGNLPLIDTPNIQFPAGFDTYDTKEINRLGNRKWEFPFIARAEGEYIIPGIDVSYFNPKTGKYNTLKTEDHKIEVLKDTENRASNVGSIISGVTKEDLKILGQDIRYINTDKLSLTKKGSLFLWSPLFFVSLFAVIALFIVVMILLGQQMKNRTNVARTKTKKANKVALKRLKKARGYMVENNKEEFFEEMLRALWGYMGDKLTITVSDLSKERLREEFKARGVREDDGEEFLNLISECEMAQYSPIGSITMDKAYNSALDLIGKMEIK